MLLVVLNLFATLILFTHLFGCKPLKKIHWDLLLSKNTWVKSTDFSCPVPSLQWKRWRKELGRHFEKLLISLPISGEPSSLDLQAAVCSSAWPSLGAAVVVWPGLFWVVDQACLLFCWWRQSVWSRMVHTPLYSFLFHRCAAGRSRAREAERKKEKRGREKREISATGQKEKKYINYSKILSVLPFKERIFHKFARS